MRTVLDGGRRRGMAAAGGAAAGNTTYAVLSALGLAAVFARVRVAFLLLRIGGRVGAGNAHGLLALAARVAGAL